TAQSPKGEIRGIGACSHRAPGGQQANRSWLGRGPRPTSAIAGIDVIGIHGNGAIQGYCSTTSYVGAGVQRDALVRDDTSIKVGGCSQRGRATNLPKNLVITSRITSTDEPPPMFSVLPIWKTIIILLKPWKSRVSVPVNCADEAKK